jgi:hypothetical protein
MKNGGRTWARTKDPLIKSLILGLFILNHIASYCP